MNDILAQNLKAHLESRNISMAELSRLSGANSTAVYDILKKRTRSPKLDTIEKIAHALDITVIELLTSGDTDTAIMEVVKVFQLLPPDDQKRLLMTATAWLAARQ